MISPKKKLLLLHSSNDLYGASKIFLQLIDLFISKDFNVHVVLPEKGKLDVFLNKKNIKIDGPFPADTIFLEEQSNKYDIIIGMYHDQVLTPIKTLFGFKAINITLGLPFLRISPDHGPNVKMLGENKSSPESLIQAIKFLNK